MENIETNVSEGIGNRLSSSSIGKLMGALSKAQSMMQPAKKDKENPFFKSTYADLASIWDVIKKPFSDNQLAVVQSTVVLNEKLYLITTIAHESGEWIKGQYPINPIKNDPQSIGSAITYARRYALASLAGVSTEDDDGNEATHGKTTSREDTSAHSNQSAQVPESRKQGFNKPQGKVASNSNNDWSKYSVRYEISFKTKEYDAKAEMENLKRLGFKFNPNDKLWYGDTTISHLSKWLRPFGGSEAKEPMQQSIPETFFDAPLSYEPTFSTDEDDIPF